MNILVISLCILAILSFVYVFQNYSEAFTPFNSNYSPYGNYEPKPQELLLDPEYEVAENPALTMNSQKVSHMKPYVSMSSYKQTTNNKRYWISPDDGSCVPHDLCNAFYKPMKPNNDFDEVYSHKTYEDNRKINQDSERVNIYTTI